MLLSRIIRYAAGTAYARAIYYVVPSLTSLCGLNYVRPGQGWAQSGVSFTDIFTTALPVNGVVIAATIEGGFSAFLQHYLSSAVRFLLRDGTPRDDLARIAQQAPALAALHPSTRAVTRISSAVSPTIRSAFS